MFIIKTYRGLILLRILVLIQTVIWIESKHTDDDPTCLPSTFRRIEIYDKLMDGFDNTTMVTSLTSCAELCADSIVCQSFGFNILNNTCYVYVKRVKISLTSTNELGMVYYWLLRDSCPTCYHKNSKLSLCFRMFISESDKKTVPDAEVRCEQDGGHLIIIDTDERRKFLAEFFLNVSGDVDVLSLVGGMELGTGTDEWYWYNGANVTNWLTNQPDDYGGIEDCLQAVFAANTTQFNDVPCGVADKYHFICEIPIV